MQEYDVVGAIHIELLRNGSLTVSGNIGNKGPTIEVLKHVIDLISTHHDRLQAGKHVVIPSHDVEIPKAKHHTLVLDTACFTNEIKGV